MSNGIEPQKAQYRTRLTFSLELVRFILRLSIPYRGHKESIDSQNRGNFLEFDEFCSVRMSDIEKAVRNAPLNFKQTSHRTQTDLIHSCGAVTRKFIISDIGHKFFSLLIDEARDNSIKEQMAIVVRYVNELGVVVERFLGLVHVVDTKAISLKKSIDEFFVEHSLSISQLRG